MKRIFVMMLLVLMVMPALAQKSKKNNLLNWYNKDLKKEKIYGLSTELAYKDLLKGRQAQTIVVAIIDGGTDINHEDLKNVLWTNPGEIAGNGIDDDNNGYIDDIHGWNFIGNPDGRNVKEDNLELTRLYRKLNKIYASSPSNTPEYAYYQKIRDKYSEKYKESEENYEAFRKISANMSFADSLVKLHLGKNEYNLKDLKKIKTDDKQLFSSVEYLKTWMALGLYPADASAYFEQLSAEYNYQYNLDFDPRYIVGDNWEENPTPYYGNNDVAGPSPGHGTFVAGCVGAERNNGIGVNGVAGNVRLMIVRVVPDGDERDKDVANAIKYAVNNGAKVVNMSFGKAYSPQKSFVDEALKLAESKDVLLIHASGNDGVNNDIITHYPENIDDNGNKLVNCWLTVGASSMKAGEDLAADFSNYGKKTVDVFAPGVDVWGLKPGNGYEAASGTSMACPVVSGLAAVIRGYFPRLNAAEVRDIIIKSCVRFDEEVNCPSESETRSKINFTELSVGGGVVNLYRAVQLADELMKTKSQ